jgi:hypothetical protein
MQILSFPNGWTVVKADGSTEVFKSLFEATDFVKHGNHDQSSHGARSRISSSTMDALRETRDGGGKKGDSKGGASDSNMSATKPATSGGFTNGRGSSEVIGDAAKEHGTSADWEKHITQRAAEKNIAKLPMETSQARAWKIPSKDSVEYADKAYAVQHAKADRKNFSPERASRRTKFRDAIMTTDAKTGVGLIESFHSKFGDTAGGSEDRNAMQAAFAQRHGTNYMVIDT